MKPIDLFLLHLSSKNTINGVDRYVEILFNSLKNSPQYKVYWLHFVNDEEVLWIKKEFDGKGVKIIIPMPQHVEYVICERYSAEKYYNQVYRILSSVFTNARNCILHVHVLNLIDFALEIKKHIPCKIITHLHCIPWKELYNQDLNRFNYLYNIYNRFLQGTKEFNSPNIFFINHNEKFAYTNVDHIICLTQCAHSFLTNIVNIDPKLISIIPNGIEDELKQPLERKFSSHKPFRFIYVGVLSLSKGILWILQALRILQQQGYCISLTIVGAYKDDVYNLIRNEYSDLDLNMLGCISYQDLKQYYLNSDAGVIASVKDQSSLVALEMAMFGLPIITSAIEGLDETFIDQKNALKVRVDFSRLTGLQTNVEHLANQMISLINNPSLQKKLSYEARLLYETKHRLSSMINHISIIYQRIII